MTSSIKAAKSIAIAVSLLLASAAAPADDPPLPTQVVDLASKLNGSHPGFRAFHGDQTKDGSQPWPDDRKVVELGVLTLNKVVPNSLEAEKKLLFVPTALTAGIELSDDPLPSVRAAAYAVSFGRRSQPSSASLSPDDQPSTVSP